jgi:pRiA4b ORF-3-like protein
MDCHPHAFDINGVEFGTPDFDDDNLLQCEREGISLKVALAGQTRFIYEYDFGDGLGSRFGTRRRRRSVRPRTRPCLT